MYYVGFFAGKSMINHRLSVSPAGQTKMEYIAATIGETIEKVTVISPAWLKEKRYGYYPTSYEKDKKYDCIQLSTIGVKTKIGTVVQWLYSLGQLTFFLLTKLKKNDVIVVYHSLYLVIPVMIAKAIRKVKVVLELEEVYQDVKKYPKIVEALERKIIKSADSYILSTEALSREIVANRPYIVVNGVYRQEPPRMVTFKDGKIHFVYAGTFDPTKGGAASAAAAEFLPENYHVHILGFGTEEQKKQLQELIAAVQKKTKCTLTYDGLKSGEEYIQFLQKCHIGLCTQIPDAKYTETSFPSKVLVYLANGLRGLSVRIPAVENSAVGGILYYYDIQLPQEIANAIMSIPMEEDYNSRQLLNQLDEDCENNLKRLMEKMNNELD